MREISIEKIFTFFIQSVPYLLVTLEYVLISTVVGFLIGAVIAKMKLANNKLLNVLSGIYLTIARCTPSIILLFIVYYGLPAVMRNQFGISIDHFDTMFFVCITFSIFIGASSSEVIRTAYEAVNKGQREAGLSIGLSEGQTFLQIILPQMIQKSLPNIGNIIIFLVKEGTLAYSIGLMDVFGRALYLSSMEYNAYAIDMYIAITFIYWPVTFLLEKAFGTMEKKLSPEYRSRQRRKTYEA